MTTATTSRHYYAVSYRYGRGTTTTSLRRLPSGASEEVVVPAAQLRRFDSLDQARVWATGGASYPGEQGYREVLAMAPARVQAWARSEIRSTLREDGPRWVNYEAGEGEVLA